MTHHTRQSALGLPFIDHKEYAGMEYDASEYTMSEIIDSVYQCMRDTGRERGILFLDEINCVSETLYPSMLEGVCGGQRRASGGAHVLGGEEGPLLFCPHHS